MGLWTTLVEKYKTVEDTAKNAATWAWDWTSKPIIKTATYVGNTIVGILNQGVALKEAIPALGSPESKKILRAGAAIVRHKLLPLIAINAINTLMLSIVRDERAEETWMQTTMLSAATLIDWGVWIYTQREGVELLVETFALDTKGASAFIEHKAKLPIPKSDDPCVVNHCTKKRYAKGDIRQPVVIALNDVLALAVSFIPYVGKPFSLACITPKIPPFVKKM